MQENDSKRLEEKMKLLAENMKILTVKLREEQELLHSVKSSHNLEPGIGHIPHCPLSNLAEIDPNCRVHGPLFTILEGIKSCHGSLASSKTSIGKFTVHSPSQATECCIKSELSNQFTEPNLLSSVHVPSYLENITNAGLCSIMSSDASDMSTTLNLNSECTLVNNSTFNVPDIKWDKSQIIHSGPVLSKSWLSLMNEAEESEFDEETESETEDPSIHYLKNDHAQPTISKPILPKTVETKECPNNNNSNITASIPKKTYLENSISKYLECYNDLERHNVTNSLEPDMDDNASLLQLDSEILNLSKMVESLTNKKE